MHSGRFLPVVAYSPPAVRYCRRVMPSIFWLGLGIAAFVFLVGVVSGARSRTASLGSGAAMGAYLGVMIAFPLLAIGLATS
jgi:hypothetical protein